MTQPRVAFLGLGIMGGGMARRLLGAGIPLTVYNRNPAKSAALAAEGARAAANARDAAEGADVVFCMVADDAASRAMWLGADGALAGAQHGAVVADCSTLTVDWVQELSQAAMARGCEFVDAPVTGSKIHAAAGELNFILGGSLAAVEKIRPALTPMSKSVTHLGPTGSGALIKLINNFVCGVQAAALAEAIAWIESTGLDRSKAMGVLTEGSPGSPLVKALAARMNTPDFTPNFLLKLMAKDLRYALEAAALSSQSLRTATVALAIFQKAIDAGYGEQDMSAVVRPLRAGDR